LISDARKGAKENEKKGVHHKSGFDLTVEAMNDKWNAQEGLCHETKCVLTLEGDQKVSFKRIDEEKGYTVDNIVLVCKNYINEKKRRLENIMSSTGNVVVENVTKYCKICGETKTLTEFVKSKQSQGGYENRCKMCKSGRAKAAKASNVDLKLVDLIRNAQGSVRDNQKEGRHELAQFNLTLENLKDKWEQQEGKCYLSSQPLMLEGKDVVSLYRKKKDKGYIIDNIVLVCLSTYRKKN